MFRVLSQRQDNQHRPQPHPVGACLLPWLSVTVAGRSANSAWVTAHPPAAAPEYVRPMTDANPARPVLHDGYFADPFVLFHGGLYYAYGTGLHGREEGRAFEVLSSPDLKTWTSHGGALTAYSPEPLDYWAPEVAVQGGRFYMYYSAGVGDVGHHLRVAVSDSPLGPFEDQGLNLTPGLPFAIDPSPFRDRDGQWYLYYARDLLDGERPGTTLAVQPLDGMTTLRGEPVTVLQASDDWQLYQAGGTCPHTAALTTGTRWRVPSWCGAAVAITCSIRGVPGPTRLTAWGTRWPTIRWGRGTNPPRERSFCAPGAGCAGRGTSAWCSRRKARTISCTTPGTRRASAGCCTSTR